MIERRPEPPADAMEAARETVLKWVRDGMKTRRKPRWSFRAAAEDLAESVEDELIPAIAAALTDYAEGREREGYERGCAAQWETDNLAVRSLTTVISRGIRDLERRIDNNRPDARPRGKEDT